MWIKNTRMRRLIFCAVHSTVAPPCPGLENSNKIGLWEANYYRTRNQKTKQDFTSSYWNPRAVPSVVMGHFCSLPTQEKTCFSRIGLHRCRDSSPHRTRVTPNLERVRSTELKVLAAQYEGRRLSISRSCLGRGSLTHFWAPFFWSEMTSCSASQKVDTELGQAATSQARPRDTNHLRPTNLATTTLSLAEHTLTKIGGDACPVSRGSAAAVKCSVRIAHFSRFCWTRQARALCGF